MRVQTAARQIENIKSKFMEINDMIQLRQETPQDYFETENLIREAFWNHYTPLVSNTI